MELRIRLSTNVQGKEKSIGFWKEDVQEGDNLEDLTLILLTWRIG
jgi:hypothetical protein